jgi:hypothetical protein
MRVRSGEQGLWVHPEARADLPLGGRGLRRTASPRPLFGGADGCHRRVEHRRAPAARRAAPPSLPPACLSAAGRLGVGRPGQPAGCHALDGLGDTLGVCGVGGGRRRGRLLGPLARGDDQTTALCQVATPVRGRHGHAPDDAGPMPASRRLLTGPPRFCEPEGPPHGAGPTPLPPGAPHTDAALT